MEEHGLPEIIDYYIFDNINLSMNRKIIRTTRSEFKGRENAGGF